MPFLLKKKSLSLLSSMSLVSTSGSGNSKCQFAKFDEKKDYQKRCNMKHAPSNKRLPCAVSFCVGKKL